MILVLCVTTASYESKTEWQKMTKNYQEAVWYQGAAGVIQTHVYYIVIFHADSA